MEALATTKHYSSPRGAEEASRGAEEASRGAEEASSASSSPPLLLCLPARLLCSSARLLCSCARLLCSSARLLLELLIVTHHSSSSVIHHSSSSITHRHPSLIDIRRVGSMTLTRCMTGMISSQPSFYLSARLFCSPPPLLAGVFTSIACFVLAADNGAPGLCFTGPGPVPAPRVAAIIIHTYPGV